MITKNNYSKWRAASRKLESKIIDLRISFWSPRFLYKTMEFKGNLHSYYRISLN